MAIQYVDMNNFQSFLHGRISFSDYHKGLHLIRGENREEPSLGANGAGKSSILAAIAFGLYGKTLRGLKASNIRNWNASGSVGVTIGFHEFDVYRQWNPNKLQINRGVDWEDIDQSQLEAEIGMNFEEFKHTTVFGQFNEFFLDLKPSEKLALLDGVFDTSYWDEKSSEANKQKKEQDTTIASLQKELVDLTNRKEELQERLEYKKESRDHFSKEKEDKLSQLRDDYESAQEEIKKLEQENIDTRNEMKQVEERKDELTKRIDQLNSELLSAKEDKQELDYQVKDFMRRIKELEDETDRMENLEGECPTCLQEVDKAHVDGHVQELEDKAEKLDTELDDVYSKQVKAGEIVKEKEEAYRNAQQEEVKQIEKKEKDLRARLTTAEKGLSKVKQDEQNLAVQIEEWEAKANPYEDIVNEIQSDIESLSTKYDTKKQEMDDSAAYRDALDYWVKAFKEIRSYVISSTISMLEMSVNNTLTELGMDGWCVRFEVEKESKSGNVQRGFYTVIENPSGEEVAWEAYSGGETQRLRISVMLGIADAISSMKGNINDVMLIDEPSSYINQEGISNLMGVLQSYAYKNDKRVFIIDHHSLEYPFNSDTLVVKDEEGSHVT